METVRRPEHCFDLAENTVLGAMPMESTEIVFHGSGNVVVFPDTPSRPLSHSSITFYGDNGVLVIGENTRFLTRLALLIHSHSTVAIGRDVLYSAPLEAEVVEGTSFLVGDECLLSFGIYCRTSDGHPIFDTTTHARINPAASIVIGDHVWIGQRASILKGARLGSGSIVGAGSIVSSGPVASNTVVAGVPARLLRSGVFYDEPCRHDELPGPTPEVFESDAYIYEADGQTLDIDDLLKQISAEPAPLDRARLLCFLSDHAAKNRFYLPAS